MKTIEIGPAPTRPDPSTDRSGPMIGPVRPWTLYRVRGGGRTGPIHQGRVEKHADGSTIHGRVQLNKVKLNTHRNNRSGITPDFANS
jgi:hypothetical protein